MIFAISITLLVFSSSLCMALKISVLIFSYDLYLSHKWEKKVGPNIRVFLSSKYASKPTVPVIVIIKLAFLINSFVLKLLFTNKTPDFLLISP